MKKHIYILSAILALVATSCLDEDFKNQQFEEGIPTEVRLDFNVEKAPIITRASADEKSEYQVNNLYIYIFDDNKNVLYQGLFDEKNISSDQLGKGSITFETQTALDTRIVGIANINVEGTTKTIYDVNKTVLDEIKTLDELENHIMNMTEQSIERVDLFVMTGYAKDKTTGSTSIDIINNATGTLQLDCTLQLERVDSKIEFVVNAEPKDPSWTEFTFLPKTWKVVNVPVQSLVLKKDGNNDANTAECKYIETSARVFEEEFTTGNITTGGKFVFYMPENKKAPKQTITETGDAGYALREDSNTNPINNPNKPGQEFENLDFKYANDNSTYVEMTGNLSYIDNGTEYNADVKFTIHLGYTKPNLDPNDYRTERNTHYQYKVTITGINDIITEVTTDPEKENRPGYEGDVIISSQKIFDLDSHYGRKLIKIHRDNINDNTTWSVRTPFSNGVYLNDGNIQGIEDYKWIKFAINREFGVGKDNYVKFPGEQLYSENTTSRETRVLRDVKQLIEHLRELKNSNTPNIFEDDGYVYITAFIDENVYVTDPSDPSINPDNQGLLLWKKTADTQDRLLHILSGDPQYSPDGNSSMVESMYTFRQRSIRTIFDVNNPNLKTAWGLESFSETDRLVPLSSDASNISNTDKANGRLNMLQWVEGKKWTEIISVNANNENKELIDAYNSAAYACMLRNRDLDGDDLIDKNEVRWYLASINQLTEIFIGEYALDERSRLYPTNPEDRLGAQGANKTYWHYTSSTITSAGQPQVVWAEEGASIGPMGGSDNDKSSYSLNGRLYSYRCVRNLGIALDDVNTEPTQLVQYTYNAQEDKYIIDMTNMNEKSRRTVTVNDIPPHNERHQYNRTYAKYEVLGKESDINQNNVKPVCKIEWNISSGYYFSFDNSSSWYQYQETNPCPTGYRIPNQRELLIMATSLPSDAWKTYKAYREYWPQPNELSKKATYMSKTSFSLNGNPPYNSNREGFMFHAEGGNFSLQNSRDEKGYVRCVRDVM